MRHLVTEVRIDKQVLDEKETAHVIGMSQSWLRQARCYGWDHAPRHMKIGKAIRYSVDDLNAWIESRRADVTR